MLINRELVGPFKHRQKRSTDVAMSGDLVECVSELATMAGWGKELEALIKGDDWLHFCGGIVIIIILGIKFYQLSIQHAILMNHIHVQWCILGCSIWGEEGVGDVGYELPL